MSAVLVAVFNRFTDAERVRTLLVSDGFPTDRVELTARLERGRAGLHPAASSREQFLQYFRNLFRREDERAFAEALAGRVDEGAAATITVHPRGGIETARAAQILEGEGAQEVVAHDLSNQGFEHAAARSEGSWLSHFALDNPGGADCIYCGVFPGHPH